MIVGVEGVLVVVVLQLALLAGLLEALTLLNELVEGRIADEKGHVERFDALRHDLAMLAQRLGKAPANEGAPPPSAVVPARSPDLQNVIPTVPLDAPPLAFEARRAWDLTHRVMKTPYSLADAAHAQARNVHTRTCTCPDCSTGARL